VCLITGTLFYFISLRAPAAPSPITTTFSVDAQYGTTMRSAETATSGGTIDLITDRLFASIYRSIDRTSSELTRFLHHITERLKVLRIA
jgi:hypothetical protein